MSASLDLSSWRHQSPVSYSTAQAWHKGKLHDEVWRREFESDRHQLVCCLSHQPSSRITSPRRPRPHGSIDCTVFVNNRLYVNIDHGLVRLPRQINVPCSMGPKARRYQHSTHVGIGYAGAQRVKVVCPCPRSSILVHVVAAIGRRIIEGFRTARRAISHARFTSFAAKVTKVLIPEVEDLCPQTRRPIGGHHRQLCARGCIQKHPITRRITWVLAGW